MAATLVSNFKELQREIRPLSRLITFFSKYPPSLYSALATGEVIPTITQRKKTNAKPLSSTSVHKATSILPVKRPGLKVAEGSDFSNMILPQTEPAMETQRSFPPNPFLPYRNPESGRWRGARIGLRQQADLFKFARAFDVEALLPPSFKSTTYKQQRILERGLAVKGTGEGRRVKGHKWERNIAETMEKRREAMEGMPELIREWEQKGHGRGWKKYPRSKIPRGR